MPAVTSAIMLRKVTKRLGAAWFVARWRSRPAVGHPRMSLRALLRLLYPDTLPPDLDLDRKAFDAVGSNHIRSLQEIRGVLGALDHHSAPTPFTVRFSPGDVTEAEVDGVKIALDRADGSVSEPMLRDRVYEPHVSAVLRSVLEPGMTFVDVGANIGFFTMLGAAMVGSTGRVIAVEPNSENCRLIVRSLELNGYGNVTLLPVALADKTGWSYFVSHLGSNGSLSGGSDSGVLGGWGQIVPTVRGDQVISGRIDVVKMDVEGAEAMVVTGLTPLIDRYRPVIVTEASEEMLARVSGSGLADYLRWFAGRGYGCAVISPDGSPPVEVPDVEDLISGWGSRFRIENLLLRPRPSG